MAIVYCLAAVVWFWFPALGWRAPRTLCVAVDGSDWNWSATQEKPLASVQRAVSLSRPGDQIVLGPGNYYERIHVKRGGTEKQPLVIKAGEPGTATITGALAEGVPSTWKWRDEGGGIFSTATQWPVHRLAEGKVTLFRVPWGGLKQLRSLVQKPSAWGAYCQDGARLYVRLNGGRHPMQAQLRTHRPAPGPREWGEFKSATVWLEADHVQLEGLRIEFGIGAAVNIWDAEHVEIRDCVFSECSVGVRCGGGVKPSEDVWIDRCLYHNYPQYSWHREWLGWPDIYAGYASSSLATARDAPLKITNCVAVHVGDALGISPRINSENMSAKIEGNYLAFGTDDAVEFDGPAVNIEFRRNRVHEFHQNLGFSPVLTGPIVVEQNVFTHEEAGVNGSQIKIMNNSPGEVVRNIVVRDNLFIGNWLCWWNEVPVDDVEFTENVFSVFERTDPPWPPPIRAVRNAILQRQRQMPLTSIVNNIIDSTPNSAWVRPVLDQRPGPLWWHWKSHPATRDLPTW